MLGYREEELDMEIDENLLHFNVIFCFPLKRSLKYFMTREERQAKASQSMVLTKNKASGF